jgi:hypothetical protein
MLAYLNIQKQVLRETTFSHSLMVRVTILVLIPFYYLSKVYYLLVSVLKGKIIPE